MKRAFTWAVFLGAILVVLAVLWQAFSIAAYVRGAGEGALDAHGAGSLFVHLGQLAIVIGVVVAAWRNWAMVAGAIGFLVLSIAQLAFLGDNEEPGGWVNGLHGALALVVLLAALAYAMWSAQLLGIRRSGAAGRA